MNDDEIIQINQTRGVQMQNEIRVLGIDVAKQIFQIHAADASGKKLWSKSVKRSELTAFVANLPRCLIGMEACGGAHHWARQFCEMGHTVKLMAPQFVKPYVKGNKNDRRDAEAIAEAVTRPEMRFVAVKETWQQDMLSVHRVRERVMKGRTALMNEMRGLLHEYGIVFAQGPHRLREGVIKVLSASDNRFSENMHELLQQLFEEWNEMERRLERYDAMILRDFRAHDVCRKLEKLDGIGPITATALVATVGNANVFEDGRQCSAFFGLVPRHDGSGGKTRMKGISKRGDRYVRKLLVHGARAVLRAALGKEEHRTRWEVRLAKRQGFNTACVALANKNARRCWAIMAGRTPEIRHGETMTTRSKSDKGATGVKRRTRSPQGFLKPARPVAPGHPRANFKNPVDNASS
jgi:transposase